MATDQKHQRQRLTVKCLHYFVGNGASKGRSTDPTKTYTSRMGLNQQQAERIKDETRELILIAADNIRAGKVS